LQTLKAKKKKKDFIFANFKKLKNKHTDFTFFAIFEKIKKQGFYFCKL